MAGNGGTDWGWAIVGGDGRIAGGAGLHTVEAGVARVGYWLHPEATGKGLATAAATEIVAFAHEQGFERVLIRMDPANEAQRGCPKRMGWRVTDPGPPLMVWEEV